eukprot:2019992-Amphidinium_carterae.1
MCYNCFPALSYCADLHECDLKQQASGGTIQDARVASAISHRLSKWAKILRAVFLLQVCTSSAKRHQGAAQGSEPRDSALRLWARSSPISRGPNQQHEEQPFWAKGLREEAAMNSHSRSNG